MAQPVIEKLKVALADTFTFYLKAHYFHWNVQGPDFKQYHELFGGIWEDVFGAVDPLAEFIRSMGAYAPGTMTRFKELTTLVESDSIPSAHEMIMSLAVDNSKVIQSIRAAYLEAESSGAYAVANFLQDRMAAHEKHGWFLHSTLGNNVND